MDLSRASMTLLIQIVMLTLPLTMAACSTLNVEHETDKNFRYSDLNSASILIDNVAFDGEGKKINQAAMIQLINEQLRKRYPNIIVININDKHQLRLPFDYTIRFAIKDYKVSHYNSSETIHVMNEKHIYPTRITKVALLLTANLEKHNDQHIVWTASTPAQAFKSIRTGPYRVEKNDCDGTSFLASISCIAVTGFVEEMLDSDHYLGPDPETPDIDGALMKGVERMIKTLP